MMLKKSALILSIILNIVLLSVLLFYFETNKVKLNKLYIKDINQMAQHFERGTPIDRYYIEGFLEKHQNYIKGSILDMQSSLYAKRFGHDITNIDVLDLSPTNKDATIIGDLQYPEQMPENKFDCFILTQTLQFPYDIKTAMKSIHQLLKDNGAVVITVPFTSQYSNEPDKYEESWRFTKYSLKRLLEEADFEVVDIVEYGNTFAAISFLEGIAVEDLKNPQDLDYTEKRNPILIAALAVKK